MGRTRTRLTVALTCVAAVAGGGVVGIVWRDRVARTAAPLAAVEQRQTEDAVVASIAAALARDPLDRDALAQLDALLPQMFDADTGIPNTASARALRHLPPLLQASATTREGRVRLGSILVVLGLHRPASTMLEPAAQAGVPNAAILPLAVALLRSDQLERVLALRPAAAGGAREQSALHGLQGRAALGLHRPDEARQAFAAALAADPGNADALLRWGLLELWQGSREEAARLLAHAHEVAPGAPATLRFAAEAAYADGDFPASAALYASLAKRPGAEPNDPIPPLFGQVRALIYQGDVAAAEALLSATREPGAALYKALAAYRAGRFQDAASHAMPLEREMAGWPTLHLLLGASLLQTGYPHQAADRLRRYLAAVPANQAAARLLAVAEQREAGSDATPESEDLNGALGFPPPAAQGPATQ